ncbi:hypothetical protein, partial [Streptomyces sp. SID8380]|uniref:hypothetical protein n=1 Tax=Streptomyces sp. SID8380 TaxID=2690360 RepID=UPI00359C9F78
MPGPAEWQRRAGIFLVVPLGTSAVAGSLPRAGPGVAGRADARRPHGAGMDAVAVPRLRVRADERRGRTAL